MTVAMSPLAGGVAVVTGAGSGIGEGIARKAASIGMRVVASDINPDRLADVAAGIMAAGGECSIFAADVSNYSSVERLADFVFATFGTPRLLVNNAGIEVTGRLWDVPPDEWRLIQGINVDGVYNGIRAFIPRMIESGLTCQVLNTSSVGGLSTSPNQAAYIVSKHAVRVMSECLELELREAEASIEVSVLLPGPVQTRIFDDALGIDEGEPGTGYISRMKLMLRDQGMLPGEVADIVFLALEQQEFWIYPHQDMADQALDRHVSMLRNRERPHLT